MTKYILTDGQKAANLLTSNDPAIWTYFGGAAKSDDIELYSKVAAAFRAYNLKANTVGSMPFTLNKLKSGEEFDNSASWENKVKFLPNPSELFRLDTLSYMATNTVYNMRTADALGYKTKGLYHAVAMGFNHVTHPVSGAFLYDERIENGMIERYPDGDKRVVRMWRLDHTTEVLPSPNTEAKAIMNAAGVIYYADSWIKHFFERGGVSPTVIAMKGAVNPTKRDEEEKSWTDWLLGLGGRFRSRIARVFNADTLDVKQFGSSVTELKDNQVYSQSLANIAMGVGMPLSLLMANSANYATAKEEKATWYENDIIPFCNWLAYGYNEQVFMPMGLLLEFHPETLDPQQEDETERAQAMNTYMDVVSKCPTFDIFVGMASTMGLELSDELVAALEAYYADREKQAEEVRLQTQGAAVDPDGKPVEKDEPTDKPDMMADGDEEDKPVKFIKAHENSAMIALRIPEPIRNEIKAKYPFVDAETLDDLHITLMYLGDSRTLDKVDIIRAVSDMGMYQAPIKGRLQGLARFVNGGEKDPIVVTFDSPQMPGLYNTLCGCLDNYHVPYSREHGFIPHMTLAYVPNDAEMPIETIEPIEVNFADVYFVDGNVWYPVELSGYDNKTKAAKWEPSLDELEELRIWREVAQRKHKKGLTLDFEYQAKAVTLPENVVQSIRAALLTATDDEQIKAAFDVRPEPAQDKSDIVLLAEAMNRLAEKG